MNTMTPEQLREFKADYIAHTCSIIELARKYKYSDMQMYSYIKYLTESGELEKRKKQKPTKPPISNYAWDIDPENRDLDIGINGNFNVGAVSNWMV